MPIQNPIERAGLEVVHSPPAELLPASDTTKESIATESSARDYEKPDPFSSPNTKKPFSTSSATRPPARSLRKLVIWLSITVAILIILTIVLGVVLCVTQSKRSPTSPTTASSTNSTPTLGRIARPNSGLAVTGWRNGSEFHIRLAYQANDRNLRIAGYNSSSGNWTHSLPFAQAKADTPLAFSSFNASYYFSANHDYFQSELFFLDDSSLIREWNWAGELYAGGNGSISSLTFRASRVSKLATYWPTLVYQDDMGDLHEIRYNFSVQSGRGNWTERTIGVRGQGGSGLAAVVLPQQPQPQPQPQPPGSIDFGVSILYQRDDWKLYNVGRVSNIGDWSAAPLEMSIPTGASIGAFSLPRPSDITKVNIYVLWQEKSGNIQMCWQDDSSGWKGPLTPDAFRGADNGTSIACLTPTIWPPSSLQANWDLSRCYFQAGGAIKEATYNGSTWNAVKDVPLPAV